MDYDELMMNFAPYIFILVGLVVAYSLYKFFSDSDLRIFLLTNSIIQFIIAGYTQNSVCIIVAILSIIPVVLSKRGSEESE